MHEMPGFADRVIAASESKDSVLVVGLDPNVDYFPNVLAPTQESGRAVAQAMSQFNRLVIDAVADYAVAVKPQLAYYEAYGSEGIRALEDTIRYAQSKGLLVIQDAKRGDIGPTASAYAQAYLYPSSPLCGDALTVNPLLGADGLSPFVEAATQHGHGIFVLVKTSNPSAGQWQDLIATDGGTLSQRIAAYVADIARNYRGEHGYSAIGAVVGSTYPQDALALRSIMPRSLLLVPGLGAQGGRAEDLAGYFDAQGQGALVSSSRGITYRYCAVTPEWKHATVDQVFAIIREAAVTSQRALNNARHQSQRIR